MSSERQKFKIEELCEVRSGKRLPLGHSLIEKATPFPYIRLVDIADGRVQTGNLKFLRPETRAAIKRYVVNSNDVCLAIVGHTIGVVFYVDRDLDDVNLTENAARLTNFRESINSRYLYYYLTSPVGKAEILARKVGSAQGKLPLYNIKSLEIAIPSRKEQDEIAEILDALSFKINLLRETNATLEAIAQALFKSWFVDFDPVRAKMAGRAPEGMDEAMAALFPDGLEESELGAVPRGWVLKTLSGAFEINPKRSLKKGAMAPYLDMASLATSGHCVEPPVQREMGSGAKFCNGDTLLARITPCLENGKSAFVDFLAESEIGWGSTEFVVLRPKAPLPEYFGYLLCRHQSFRDHAINSMSGTSGRQRIQNDVLERYLLAMPDGAVASAFTEIVEPIQRSIAGNHRTAHTLASLRDTLLPRLISGQLRLAVLENQIETITA